MNKSILSIKLLLLIMIHFFLANLAFSQNNLDNYFDDDNLASIKNIIKTGYDPRNGEVPIVFERQIIESLSLEGGISIISLKKQFDRFEEEPLPGLKDSGVGLGILAGFRFYFSNFYEKFYGSSSVKLNFMSSKTYFDVNIINFGYQLPIKNKFVIDLSAGMGFRFFKAIENVGTSVESEEWDSRVVYPIQIKIGYAF